MTHLKMWKSPQDYEGVTCHSKEERLPGLVLSQLFHLEKLILLGMAGGKQPGAEQNGHGHIYVVIATFFCSEGGWGRRQVLDGVDGVDGVQ